MYIDKNIELTPSNFAEYCYCGIKWAFSKSKWVKELNSMYKSEHTSEKKLKKIKDERNLQIGQKNESLCIKYLEKEYSVNEIIFDGTGESRRLIETEIIVGNKPIYAKPDFIANVGIQNEINLYEFKAVSKLEYLEEIPFESVKAQIWLYQNLKDFKINNYYLLRYFKNPMELGNVKLIKIDYYKSSQKYFYENFKKYIKAFKKISKKMNDSDLALFDPSDSSAANNILFNPPKHKEEKWKKCSGCSFNSYCQYNRLNWNKKKSPYFK